MFWLRYLHNKILMVYNYLTNKIIILIMVGGTVKPIHQRYLIYVLVSKVPHIYYLLGLWCVCVCIGVYCVCALACVRLCVCERVCLHHTTMRSAIVFVCWFQVRTIRDNLFLSANFKMSKRDLRSHIDTMVKLLEDPVQLILDTAAKDAVQRLKTVKCNQWGATHHMYDDKW